MFVLLCQVLAGATRHQKNCILAIVEIPGSIRLATLLCMLDAEGSLLTRAETCRGTLNLLSFLYDSNGAQVNISPLDEVLGAVGGNAKLFIDTLLSRIEDALPSPVLAEKTVASFLNLFVVLPDHPKHPLSIALRARNPSAFLIKVLHRLLEILSEDSAKCSDSDLARRVRRLIAAILAHITIAVLQRPGRTKLMLEMLQGGIMTILVDCAPWAFSFKPCDRDKMVLLLKLLTSLTTRLPIARQASAELERIEGKYSVQARINASMPIIRKLWAILYNTIIARRTVLAQMQSLNSTPMACDNCFRFDERATFKKCANCGMAHYCSKECQSRAWKEGGHRTQCKSLKENPPKSKGRAMNQDRYFLARVAVNDAQQKREHLEQMALIGLKYVSVIIDYTESPPSCNAQCDAAVLR
ncbi:hypothetical protein SCHPADRAFT_350229 [Schizopora paradoxa]|uniref:MYND-type domain-containing protein n=1 Tax=Schizopora paradoxa TaxID=27342 RepID=A0A0H2RP24_9AGAM|nr:hypothetical protein SCHPADRAFT_350229 [Schizopora paradoxa]